MKSIYAKLYKRIRDIGLRKRLMISYIILIAIPISIISVRYYSTSLKVTSELTSKNIYEIVQKNNEIINGKLAKIEENSSALLLDKNLYEIFSRINFDDGYSILFSDKEVRKLILKYFPPSRDIYSVIIATSYYTFGDTNSAFIPNGTINKTRVYSIAERANGKLQWVPTYDYADMFNFPELKKLNNIDYRYLFSAVRMLNCSYIENGNYISLDKSIERPILIINLKESVISNVFKDSIPIKGSTFLVLDSNGSIVSCPDEKMLSTVETKPWAKEITARRNGTQLMKINGKNSIVCYNTSAVTGWTSVAIIPANLITGEFAANLRNTTIFLSILLIVISLVLSIFISGTIVKPVKKLYAAAKAVGEGNFGIRLSIDGNDELAALTKNFNNMNENIRLLINENYEVKLRKKEAEIMSLNIQLNPHFLYNTINVINWMAIGKEQNEISTMLVSLSSMLQYTSHNTEETKMFKDDLEWLRNYALIMSTRFEGKFDVEYFINPALDNTEVPKLFLQPFIENSIIHGFANKAVGGKIKLYGWIQEDRRYFCVEDNGSGMDLNKIEEINSSEVFKSIGIKNVDKRIKLIYGNDYGVKIESLLAVGTKITVILPL